MHASYKLLQLKLLGPRTVCFFVLVLATYISREVGNMENSYCNFLLNRASEKLGKSVKKWQSHERKILWVQFYSQCSTINAIKL